MAAPPLRIPMSLDLQSFQQQTEKAGKGVNAFLKQVAQQFDNVNSTIASQTALSATRIVAAFGSAILVAKLLGDAIDATRAQLVQMVEVADKAANSKVGAAFFQQFLYESQKLKVGAEDMEGALKRAFDATKEKSPIDLAKWETGEERITEVEKALRVFNATGEKLQALVLFRDAENQEQKIEAILKGMVELEQQGRKLESLQLGELFFGTKFVDNIRLGKTSAESILQSMKAAREAGSGVFSEEMVARAKQVDTQLQLAHQRLSRELTPQFTSLANTLLDIKGIWADIINLIAQAVRLVNQIDLSAKKSELAAVNDALEKGTGLHGIPRIPGADALRAAMGQPSIDDDLRARARKLTGEIDELEGRSRPQITVNRASRGAGEAPTQRDEGSSRDRFDAAADTIEKRTAALQAEASTINLNTAARERAKVVAELETVAKQVNTAAGINNGQVTEEQRARIEALANSYEAARARLEQLNSPLNTFARDAANVNRQLQEAAVNGLRGFEDALISIVQGTKSAKEAFRDMANAILADLARIAIRQAITGPIAAALGFSLPGRAVGGPVDAGSPYVVGEKGPEVFVPGRAGTIIPNNALRSGGSSTVVPVTINADFRGAAPQAVGAIAIQLQQLKQQIPGMIITTIKSARPLMPGVVR